MKQANSPGPFSRPNTASRVWWCCLLFAMLSACGSPYQAPVGELGGTPRYLNDGRTHRVNEGETLYAIAWMYSLDFTQLARANNLREPYVIYPGDMLQLNLRNLPASSASSSGSAATVNSTRNSSVPTSRRSAANNTASNNVPAKKTVAAPSKVPVTPPQPRVSTATSGSVARSNPAPSASVSANGPVRWSWPANGAIVGRFSSTGVDTNGIDIAGNKGDAVKAAADGVVVYAGSGLLRYGDLIIVKHNEHYLSAYAHNSRLLVSEGTAVKQGQKVAELGSSGIDRTMLHFEIRLDGKPVDPLPLLPAK